MKYLMTLSLLLIAGLSFAQKDHNGNPVFNSLTVATEQIKNFELISCYYTLKNNIEKKWSSVYISENPSLDEIENAAIGLNSDYFEIVKHHTVIAGIIIMNRPAQFMTIDMTTGKKYTLPCPLTGDITENRAREIVSNKYDLHAKIKKNKLYFNGKVFSIITNREIKTAVLNLIETERLNQKDSSQVIFRSANDIKAIVIAESKPGGNMDFFTPIVGHEFDGIQVKPGIFDTKLGMALYQWGAACFDLGVNTVEDALSIFGEYKGRRPNQREEEYIKMGFGKDLSE